jgi:predicted nucleic acid-binding protein
LSTDQALLLIENIRDRLTLISLSSEEYLAALEFSAAARITGGTVYDALLAQCARKSSAETVYTWNVKHFQQFGSAISGRLQTP